MHNKRTLKVALYTLGCKLKQAETDSLVDQFHDAGYQPVSPNDIADIYIANT
ncbi:MAG: tRNA (N(6)-L-threonylcarbamoyladenosine(37)-C(2))-methylthiotransferase MtaB, partial [Chloroflexi bacterium]